MYSLSKLKEMFELSKVLKSDYIIFDGNTIIGSDQFGSKLVVTHIDGVYPYLSFNSKEMASFLKNANDNIVISGHNLLSNSEWVSINNMQLDMPIMGTYRNVLNKDFSKWQKDLTDNEEFRTACSSKVSEGIRILQLNMTSIDNVNINFPISIYGGLLPIVKKDNISIGISFEPNTACFCSKYTIFKSKNSTVDVYINYLFI